MASRLKYFIGNWKMFGIPSSFKILDKINLFFQKDKKNNRKYRLIIAPPFTLLHDFSYRFRNKKIIISAQNSYHKDNFGAYTGKISPFMIKKMGVDHIIIGHSENRASGDNDKIIKEKVLLALKNNMNIIFCIGENSNDKKRKKTLTILKNQIAKVLDKKYNLKKIFIAYEPIWSIGSGKVLSGSELRKIVIFIKKFIKQKYKLNYNIKFLYGGSVDKNIISNFKSISELDGFLIGGAFKSSKNFIDIIRNFYK